MATKSAGKKPAKNAAPKKAAATKKGGDVKKSK